MNTGEHPWRRGALVVAGLVVLLGLIIPAAAADRDGRIIAIGDVHGNYDGLARILGEAGLVDDQLHWSGGAATLVQNGDLFDRGARVRDVLDLLMRLQKEAEAAGGQVICLLGNHEAMNLLGLARDVNPEVYQSFVDRGSKRRRARYYDGLTEYLERRASHFEQSAPTFNRKTRNRWIDATALGVLEYRDALTAEGTYGAWLRTCPAAVLIDDVLFIHGGISPSMAGMSVDDINRKVAAQIAELDDYRSYMESNGLILPAASIVDMVRVAEKEIEASGVEPHDRHHDHAAHARRLEGLLDWESWCLLNADGPLWFRGAAKWDEHEYRETMAEMLDGVGARYMVAGHTPQKTGRIQSRFEGRVYLIDTGMLSSYYTGGRPSALEIANGVFTAIYPDSREELARTQAAVAAAE